MPQRIQRKRTPGWRMPEGAVYVGRPTIFGNPFKGDRAVEVFERYLTGPGTFDVRIGSGTGVTMARVPAWWERAEVMKALPQLAGKDLACWCSLDEPCHADILLRLANGGT